VLDLAVGPRKDQALVAVVEPDQIGRRTVGAAHLDDLTKIVRIADLATMDV
jgi:hypothetical protein